MAAICHALAYPCLMHNKLSRLKVNSLPSSQGDYFQTEYFQKDVVEYGSRYDRPDRFARVQRPSKQPSKSNTSDWSKDVESWLRLFCHNLNTADYKKDVESQEGLLDKSMAARHSFLLKCGRLEECFVLLEDASRNHPSGLASLDADRPLRLQRTGYSTAVDHMGVCIAALNSGSVDLAFEYVGLLPPSIYAYNVLLAAIICFGLWSAIDLPLETAKRRGIQPDKTSAMLQVFAQVKMQNNFQALLLIKKAFGDGLVSREETLNLIDKMQRLEFKWDEEYVH